MIESFKKIVDDALLELCDNISVDNSLKKPITYSLLSGGKRLRPILVLSSYNLFKDNFDSVMPFALGIELLHNYSLIHDDLPAMDDDDYRRGMQTVHKKFDEAIAILTGDALLTYAFELMLNAVKNTEDSLIKTRKIESIELISKKVGINGMILGQVIDIEDGMLSLDELLFMYRRKTSDLFDAALSTGAIIGGADENEQKIISDFAHNLGLVFQIKDDLIDHDRDMQIGKVTVATSLGLNESKKIIEEHYISAIKCLDILKNKYNRNINPLSNVLNFIKNN